MSQKENYHLNLENSPPQFFNMEKNLPTPDNETVKKKLEYLEGILEMANKFETTKSLFDLKTFLKDVRINSLCTLNKNNKMIMLN